MAHQQSYPQPGFNVPPPQYNNPNPPIVVTSSLGESPVRMVCPNCRNEILTSIETEFSLPQHIAFFVMCITGACLICSCIPYCMDSLSNVRHQCPNCKTHLGTYKRCNWSVIPYYWFWAQVQILNYQMFNRTENIMCLSIFILFF